VSEAEENSKENIMLEENEIGFDGKGE